MILQNLDIHLTGETVNAVDAVRTLRQLRAGEVDEAINGIEVMLDGSVMSLLTWARLASEKQDPQRLELWALVAAYRDEHPSPSPYPEVVASVAELSDLVAEGTGRVFE